MLDSNQRSPANASSHPNRPPAEDRTALSTRSWRIMRVRPAPIAIRIEISRDRTAARASSRLATFAHAISNTNPTAHTTTTRKGRIAYTP